jgi:hydroxyacylglutathione hydrolase
MFLERLYDDALAQASYLIGCEKTGTAIVIDPLRDPERYLAAAAARGARIAVVTETHIHADFVSGARELAERARARLLLSGEGGEAWRYRYAAEAGAEILCDGSRFGV